MEVDIVCLGVDIYIDFWWYIEILSVVFYFVNVKVIGYFGIVGI